MDAIVSCENITMKYNAEPVVCDVSFKVDKGDFLCIVGENGSGKSTLMKGILGLVKVSAGQIIFNNIKTTEIGYLPQQTIVQKDFPASVFEVVISGCLNSHGLIPFYSNKDKERTIMNLKNLGIYELSKKSYRDLSGGQQQRVLLARALCSTTKLLLLDEPVTGLDPNATANMYSLLQSLNQEGLTIIMISHDVKSSLNYGNKILHLQKSPLYFGSVKDYANTGIKMLRDEGGIGRD